MRRKVYDDALRWANSIRKQKKLPPLRRLPRGIRSDAGACPLAQATGCIVARTYYREVRDGPTISAPRCVERFTSAFDNETADRHLSSFVDPAILLDKPTRRKPRTAR